MLGLVVVATGVQIYFEHSQGKTVTQNNRHTQHNKHKQTTEDLAVTIYVLLLVMAFFVLLFESIVKGGNLIPKANPKPATEEDDEVEEVRLENLPPPSFSMTDSPRGGPRDSWTKM